MASINGSLILFQIDETPGSEAVLACSQSSTLTINQASESASCKDSTDKWVSAIDTEKSYEISTNGLYDDAADGNFDTLANLIITGPNLVNFIFGSETVGAPVYSGTIKLTSTSLQADDNSFATYSGSFMGDGALVADVVSV